jgi:TolB-like protein
VESGHPAIAVLPFANLTGSPDQDYLSEGLSAGLISRLAEVSGVRVAGRSATWGGNAAKLTPRRLASQLGVSLFVEGEVQQSAEGLKVDVKLTDPDSGLVLWSRGFEGQAEELFVIQRDITRQLAAVLEVPLSSKEIRRLALDPTGSFKAYDFYLRGQQRLGDFTDERSIDTGIEMFRQAIRLDPEFALAHVGLSEALWWSYLLDSSGDKLVEAEKEVLRALDIDPGLPAALVELARVYRSTGRYSASIDELQKVLANHPKPDEAQRELAASYERVGATAC